MKPNAKNRGILKTLPRKHASEKPNLTQFGSPGKQTWSSSDFPKVRKDEYINLFLFAPNLLEKCQVWLSSGL